MDRPLDLVDTGFTIVGPRGSGKSTLARHILNSVPPAEHLVYDPMGEYAGYRRIVPNTHHDVEELNAVIQKQVIPNRPRLFIIDEANRYVRPAPTRLPEGIAMLNDLSRHWHIAWGAITRRPSMFHTDIFEMSNYIFIFGLSGANDLKKLKEIHKGLDEAVYALPRHHFVVVDNIERRFYVHNPVHADAPPGI